jgi:DNA-binding SARP family transcriptional activator
MVVDGETRSLSSPGAKAVLGLLLLASGRVLTRETLVDALWGDDPPRTRRTLCRAGSASPLLEPRP